MCTVQDTSLLNVYCTGHKPAEGVQDASLLNVYCTGHKPAEGVQDTSLLKVYCTVHATSSTSLRIQMMLPKGTPLLNMQNPSLQMIIHYLSME